MQAVPGSQSGAGTGPAGQSTPPHHPHEHPSLVGVASSSVLSKGRLAGLAAPWHKKACQPSLPSMPPPALGPPAKVHIPGTGPWAVGTAAALIMGVPIAEEGVLLTRTGPQTLTPRKPLRVAWPPAPPRPRPLPRSRGHKSRVHVPRTGRCGVQRQRGHLSELHQAPHLRPSAAATGPGPAPGLPPVLAVHPDDTCCLLPRAGLRLSDGFQTRSCGQLAGCLPLSLIFQGRLSCRHRETPAPLCPAAGPRRPLPLSRPCHLWALPPKVPLLRQRPRGTQGTWGHVAPSFPPLWCGGALPAQVCEQLRTASTPWPHLGRACFV